MLNAPCENLETTTVAGSNIMRDTIIFYRFAISKLRTPILTLFYGLVIYTTEKVSSIHYICTRKFFENIPNQYSNILFMSANPTIAVDFCHLLYNRYA